MKAEVALDGFNRALRSVRPALKDAADDAAVVHLSLADDELTLVATGRTMTFRQRVPILSASEGEVVVPARFLAEVCLRGTDPVLKLSVASDGELLVRCGQLSATVRVHSTAPPIPVSCGAGDVAGRLRSDELARLASVTTAASEKLERPVLTGVHLGPGVAEATDSYRAVRTALSQWTVDAVLPVALIQSIATSPTDVSAVFDGRIISFTSDIAAWIGPVIASAYPALEPHFAASVEKSFTCDRRQLAEAVTTAGVVGASIHLVGQGDRLRVWSESTQVGLVETTLSASAPVGYEAAFGFRYLGEALKIATTDDIQLDFTEKFVLIRCDQFIQLVMQQVDRTSDQEA